MQGDKSDNTRKRGLDEVMSDSGPEKRLRKENCVDKMAQGYTSDVQSMNDTPLSESSGSGSCSEPPTTTIRALYWEPYMSCVSILMTDWNE